MNPRPHQSLDVELVVRGGHGELAIVGSTAGAPPTAVEDLLAIVGGLQDRRDLGGIELHLAADQPLDHDDPLPEAVADRLGLHNRRDLFQLRRPLPVEPEHPVREVAPPLTTRPIDLSPGSADRAAWLRVNNRAFAHHADQGAETEETLEDRLDADGHDAAGFLVADDPERSGELLGFCWTKVHAATADDPALGEIYVIGVDPHHDGKSYGKSLVLAGLDHLASTGIGTGMLYVDADNGPARHLYDKLGFVPHHRRRVYTAP